jgi:membrane protein
MSPRQGWQLLKAAVKAWSDDYAPSMGAALSYYTLFSIAPLLLIVTAVAGWFFGDQAVRGELVGSLQYLMGEEGAKAIEGLLAAVSKPREGIVAGLIGLFVLMIGATTVFGELQNNLDRIWHAPAHEVAKGWWRLLRSRLLSLGMILGIAFLLMVSLVFDAVLQSLGKMWGTGMGKALAQVLNACIAFGLTTTVFAMIYKLMPRAKIEWHDVWVGAAVTAALFAIGKYLIGLYIGRSAVASAFGAAGSLVVVMVWVYYSAQIFLLGAEFTWVYAHSHGSRSGIAVEEKEQPPPPVPMRAAPVLHQKPLLAFGAAAALGALARLALQQRPRPRPGIFSRR